MTEQLYRAVTLPSEEPVQYVGVYVLKWGKVPHPTVGFIAVEDDDDNESEAQCPSPPPSPLL